MPFEICVFVFLLLQTYSQVAHSDIVHNEISSGGYNISLSQETTTDVIDHNLRLNNTLVYEEYNDMGLVKHVSKEKHITHKTGQTNLLQNVNTTEAEEEDNIQVASFKRSLNTIPTRNLDKQKTCEAMVLTYGPIGFTSALELIANANDNHNHSLHKNNEPSNSSGSNVTRKLKRMVIRDPAVTFSSQEKYMYVNTITARKFNMDRHGYKSEEGDIESNDNVQINVPNQNHQQIRNKQRAERIISDSTHAFGYSNENEAVESEALRKEKVVFVVKGNNKTQDENKYSVLHVLLQQNLSGLNLLRARDREDEMKKSSESSPVEVITSRRESTYSKPLSISNKSGSWSTNDNIDQNKKPCPKQPKFIDKITIDKGNFNNNQQIAVRRRGIDTKTAQEHFRAKTKLLEGKLSSYGGKSVGKENDEKEIVTLLALEENSDDAINKSFDSGNIQQKTIQRRYIPQLHPMPETENYKNKDAVLADHLSMVGGRNKFDGQNADEIRNELVGHFHKWPKTREWLYTDGNTNIDENSEPTNIKLPIRIYESSPAHGDLYLESLGSAEMYQNTNINENNVPTNIKLPIRIYESSPDFSDLYLENLGPEDKYDRNIQDPHLDTDDIFVYLDDNFPDEFVSEPPFQYKLYHKEHDNNYNIPFNQENNERTMTVSKTNEADYYPIDYQYLLTNNKDRNGYVIDPNDHNEAMFQQNGPEYRYDETRPVDMPILYETDQQYSTSDYPQSFVSGLGKITDVKKQSKPKLKIFKVHVKPTDYVERNTNQKKETIGCKTRITAHTRKKKMHRKRHN